jgi:hypothetical protein
LATKPRPCGRRLSSWRRGRADRQTVGSPSAGAPLQARSAHPYTIHGW